MEKDIKEIFENMFGKTKTNHYFGAGYYYIMPFTTQKFPVRSLLTNILYLFRWGFRRGKGEFIKKFGDPNALRHSDAAPTAYQVADKLSGYKTTGFDDNLKKNILADLFLASFFENKKLSHNRHEIILRKIATHYFSSWVDLPNRSSHLRSIPELFVSIMADQEYGRFLDPEVQNGNFRINCPFDSNTLLSFFGTGTIRADLFNLSGDRFDDSVDVGIDQLLAIRIAEYLECAPLFDRTEKKIKNIHPVAKKQTRYFFEDFSKFIDTYISTIPRKTIIPMIESSISIGLTGIYTALIRQTLEWSKTYEIKEQNNFPVFVDCSGSASREIRNCAEQTIDPIFDLMPKVSLIIMVMRILDMYVLEKGIKYTNDKHPDPTGFLNLLGSILEPKSSYYNRAYSEFQDQCNLLSNSLSKLKHQHLLEILENEEDHPVLRLAQLIVIVMGKNAHQDKYSEFLKSTMMTNEYNGILKERKTTINGKYSKRHSLVLSSTALEYLVHRHIAEQERLFSLREFIRILKERYGFYIDEAPPGYSFSFETLKENRLFFERHLRDLGLFIGVNDSESMKGLKSRFN